MANKKRYFGTIEKLKTGWRLRVTVGYNENGRPIRRSKMTKTKNAREREKELNRFIDDLEKNGYEAPSKLTFKEFVENEWLPKHAQKHLAYNTWYSYYLWIKDRIYPIFESTQIEKITTMQVVNFMDKLQQEGTRRSKTNASPLSARSIRNIYKAFRSVLNTAVEWKIITNNPTDNIKLPKVKKIVPNVYNKHEQDLLFKALEKENDLRWKCIVSIALVTGCREGELVALEKRHLDFNDSKIRFEQKIIEVKGSGVKLESGTKNEVIGYVSVPIWLMTLLKEYIAELDNYITVKELKWENNEFLFCNESGKPMRPDSISQRWIRFLKRYDLKSIRFHDLRHTSATWLINKGVPAKVVQERLRHKKYTTTLDMYSHLLEETDMKAANEFENPF